MSLADRASGLITNHARAVIAVMVLLTLVIGAGAGMVEQSSSLDQFQGDTPEAEKLTYIEENFSTGPENQTSVQLIVREDNVLDKDTLVRTLEMEQSFRANETINGTLAANQSMVGVANAVATGAIRQEQAAELQTTAAEFDALNRSIQQERAAIDQRNATLNATAGELRGALRTIRADQSANVTMQFEQVRANTTIELDENHYAVFEQAAADVRNAENRTQLEAAYQRGTAGVLTDEYAALDRRGEALQDQVAEFRDLGEQLQDGRTALENAPEPTLAEQLTQLESMNESRIDETVRTVLSADTGEDSALAFMPTGYDPGNTTANATMLLVTQDTNGEGVPSAGIVPDRIIDAQLAMQDVATAGTGDGGPEVIVFGSGMITEEINNSMIDSLLIVGPLALLFVVLALAVAYRDVIDILLGVAGIGAVLTWTFGFMGWVGIDFNQMFIAVPVLLIGLSIDYAIHIFMRHREEREELGNGVRGSMKVALAGVGIALVWVTATTVIGFLANLTSPVPPIRDFGVVSAFGITAALLVFGLLVPALKVLIDGYLEGRGWDRTKRAFGTGGGRFSSLLTVGSTAAKKAPFVVIALALVLSAGGALGATQVDTSFNQEDFLAEEPPGWMEELPEPFAPSEYTAKQHLAYVNDNFLREDSQAQILIDGSVATPQALSAVANASEGASASNVTTKLADGEANIQSPLTAMEQVAAGNETFNATLAAADTDGDGVPDRDVDGVYDSLYDVAPDTAAGVVHRTEDGRDEALRLVVSTDGNAAGSKVTEEMRAIAGDVDAVEGLTAVATGQTILFTIVQDQLLQTVVESLLITLVAVFAFLMFTYRITEGSATLGAVTLLPVVLSVTWILGTMYLADIPFNVLTGMITSLTVGLGVAYSIHLSERYNQELERTGSVWTAMERAVTGTGGALLGSAATTVGGFGVLVFAILPPLQQFGLITGLTIIYAFLASVLVLPSLLVVWTKYLGPGLDDPTATGEEPTGRETPAAEDD